MVLCVNAKTKIKDLVIEYIEVVLKNGEFVNLNWDYSEIERTPDGFVAFYRGLCFGEEHARNCLDKLKELSVACVGLYSEEPGPWDIGIDTLDFDDNGNMLVIEDIHYEGEDGEQVVKTYCDLEDFARSWLQQNQYDLKDYFVVADPDEPAELGDLFDIAYDMKGDIEKSTFNPYPDNGKDFDCWYDEFVLKIHAVLRSIAYEEKMGVSE